MAKVEYSETDQQKLDLISPLRQKLIEYHLARSPKYFLRRYRGMNVVQRNPELLEKASKGKMRIDLAKDMEIDELVGYYVSTITEDRQGEIDSIYVESNYRGLGIGENLVKRALRWMDESLVTRKILEVGVGNEEVFIFYSRYNFYPRTVILEQVETKDM